MLEIMWMYVFFDYGNCGDIYVFMNVCTVILVLFTPDIYRCDVWLFKCDIYHDASFDYGDICLNYSTVFIVLFYLIIVFVIILRF